MSSEQRSNSAVRNLRARFEQQASESSPAARGRSPGLGSDHLSSDRPTSKVRASFFAVEPARMASPAPVDLDPQHDGSPVRRASSAGRRRPSFSGGQSGDAIDAMKETVSNEAERRENESSVKDTIPETAIESVAPTPLAEVDKQLGGAHLLQGALEQKLREVDRQAKDPGNAVAGAEEEPPETKPADSVREEAVSGGVALEPVVEDPKQTASNDAKKASTKPAASRTANSTKPVSISTKAAPKASPNSAKSPLSPPVASKPAITKKASRSSLTAPTAASVARAAAADKAAASKPKPTTKPVEISSRLTAPTAASRARLDVKDAVPAPRSTATSRTAPKTASARPTPRNSLAARPDSRTSQSSSKRPAGPVDGSFLERMTRPTAASSNRIHEKTEVKSPPKSKSLPLRPKTNGHAKGAKPTTTKAAVEPVPDAEGETTIADEEPSYLPNYEQNNTTSVGKSSNDATKRVENEVMPTEPVAHSGPVGKGLNPAHDVGNGNGSETPIPQTNGHEDVAALEDTPAAIGGEDLIR